MNKFSKRLLLSLSAILLVSACKNADEYASDKGQSAKMVASGSEGVESEAAAKLSDAGEHFKSCRAAFNAHNELALAACYDEASSLILVDHLPPVSVRGAAAILAMIKEGWAASSDLSQQAQLVLRKGNQFAAIVLRRGTNDDERTEQLPGTQSVSTFQGEVVAMTPTGRILTRQIWIDQRVLAHQLGTHPREGLPDRESAWPEQIWQVAEDSARESANLSIIAAMTVSIQRDDLAGYMEHVADNVEFRNISEREGRDGKSTYREALSAWTAATDHTMKRTEVWAAGDWVVAVSDHVDASKGEQVKSRSLEFFRLADDKLKSHWLFENSIVH